MSTTSLIAYTYNGQAQDDDHQQDEARRIRKEEETERDTNTKLETKCVKKYHKCVRI